MTTNENSSEAPLTWTSSTEWGTIGRTHRAEVTLDNGDTWKFVVDQPRKGVWTARGWRNGVFAMYREGKILKDAKAQSQEQANRAATQTCTTCRKIGGHKLDCSAVLPVPADAARHATAVDLTPMLDAAAQGMRELHAAVPAPVVHSVPSEVLKELPALAGTLKRINANLWTNRRRPADCSCPTPTHRMSCGHGARPKVVQKRTPRRFGVTGSRVVLVSVDQ